MVGAVIGSYQIIRKLGSGGMGAVYLGQHALLGRRAAIKVLLPSLSARQDVIKRFFNEARAVTTINDPGIVQVFDFGHHTDGSAFIVMEFLEGEPLDRRLAKRGKLPVSEVMRLGQQIANSLAAAHAKRIIHRDLKPENIFLVRDSGFPSGERTKVLDFGIAKLSGDQQGKNETHTGVLMGTPKYMSPEQCRGTSKIDHRSDIYSLGCVMFHLITGRPPFDGEGVSDIISAQLRDPAPAPSSLVAEVPAAVDSLVLRCLLKAPADRFHSMTGLTAALNEAVLCISASGGLPLTPRASAMPASASPAYQLPPQAISPPEVTVPPTVPPTAPTTLGASTGHLVRLVLRPPRVGRWIAASLVAASVILGIAIIRPHDEPTHVVTMADIATAATPVQGSATVAVPTIALDAGAGASSTPGPTDDKDITIDDAAVVGAADPPPPVTPSPAVTSKPVMQPKATPPRLPAPPGAPSPQRGSASKKCKADFAAVAGALAPSNDEIRAALRNLNACHRAGAITNDEFERYQPALIKKLH